MQRLPLIAVALAVLASAPAARAHESRPAYLETNETAPGRYDVLWRTPLLSGMRPSCSGARGERAAPGGDLAGEGDLADALVILEDTGRRPR